MGRFILKCKHFLERVKYQSSVFIDRMNTYGFKVAIISFYDGCFPPEKRKIYLNTISEAVDDIMENFNKEFNNSSKSDYYGIKTEKKNIWICWWQGLDSMPEIVRMCFDQLNKMVDKNRFNIVLITNKNYKNYVEFPEHIVDKFENNIITMTTMSDILRFTLLYKYGGYWLDSTVFFTDSIPMEYTTRDFYCQKMTDPEKSSREACQGKWCGFSMAGNKNNILFKYMKEAFSYWWEHYDSIIDYVLIDYLLLSGYNHILEIKSIIDSVEDNNVDIFEMYRRLNEPYSKELYAKLTKDNVMHKLTYKMDLEKRTKNGELTLYGYLYNSVYDIKE